MMKPACILLILCLVPLFPIFADDIGLPVYHSSKISDADTLKEIESLQTISAIEAELLAAQQRQSELRHSRIEQLYQRGNASEIAFKKAKIQTENATTRASSERHFGNLVKALQTNLSLNSFIDHPDPKPVQKQEFQVRLPGLSLRSGGTDLFTVRMAVKPETTHATKKYTAARLLQNLAVPHNKIIHDLFEERHSVLSGIPSAQASELNRSKFHLATVRHLQLLANHRFATRWRQGRRIEQYSAQVSDQSHGGNEVPPRTFTGSKESFWLFGDGEAVANPTASLSTSDLHFVQRKAESIHAETRASSEIQTIQRRYDRLQALQPKGYSNPAELREVKLALDMAKLQLSKAQAEIEIAKKEFAQVSAAATPESNFSSPVPIPAANGISKDSSSHWMAWIKERPTTDGDEILRFLNLLKTRFQSAAESTITRRQLDFENQNLSLYLKIPSLYTTELEIQTDLVTKAQTEHARALEKENLEVMKIQQWAQRINRPNQSRPTHSPEVIMKIMEAGRQVNIAKADLARIEIKKRNLKYQFDIDYLDRLRRVKKRGAATQYEIATAENQVLRSKGLLYTSVKDLAIVKQQAIFLKVLYESGSISFDEARGLEISRFMPAAGEELKKLTILKDSVDEGAILHYEAGLADSKNRVAELNRLVKTGHASPIEVSNATARRKQLENSLAVEKARGRALKYSLDLIKSLEYEPDTDQILKPSDHLKL